MFRSLVKNDIDIPLVIENLRFYSKIGYFGLI